MRAAVAMVSKERMVVCSTKDQAGHSASQSSGLYTIRRGPTRMEWRKCQDGGAEKSGTFAYDVRGVVNPLALFGSAPVQPTASQPDFGSLAGSGSELIVLFSAIFFVGSAGFEGRA